MSEASTARRRRSRVVLVDDHGLFRAGVRAELAAGSAAERVEVVGEAEDVASAVAVVVIEQPDVVLLDVHLPGGGGAQVMAGVGDRAPRTRFLALSVSDAAEDVIGTIRAGARGYVTKTVSRVDLLDAIDRVAEGDAVFSPRLAGFVLDAFTAPPVPSGPAPVDPELDLLTERERDVVRLIARGYTYKESAADLFVSVKTVETHMGAVLRKLQLSNRHELSRWAYDREV